MFLTALSTWIRGLLSLAIVIAGALLIKEWVDDLPRFEPLPATPPAGVTGTPLTSIPERVGGWSRDPDRSTAPLVWGGVLLLLAIGGRLVSPILWKRGGEEPLAIPVREERLETRNGHALRVDLFGREDAPPLVLVHGLGSDRTQWRDAIEDLSGSFRVIAYDLFGHGRSAHRPGADHSLEAMARDLDDVMAMTGDRKLIVAGHSMGGMIALTWCRLNAARVRDRLAGLILVHTTPRNPFETMAPVPLHRKLQKPLHEPLLRVTAALAPVVRVMNRLAYWNGSIHWDNELQLFAGRETREQLERSARIAVRIDPATQARCALALTRYDATGVLGSIGVPTLVVAADKDGVTVPEASEAMAEEIRGADLLVLEPARHMGFLEWREIFAEAVSGLARIAFKEPARATGEKPRSRPRLVPEPKSDRRSPPEPKPDRRSPRSRRRGSSPARPSARP